MRLSTHKFSAGEPAWLRYSFALLTCALAILVEVLFDHYAQSPITPFLTGFAAVIASGAWAGPGPGLLATLLLASWSALDLTHYGIEGPSLAVRCGMFLLDGLLLTVGSARMWRSMKEAARSETWHRELVETAAEGIWVHDEQGLITYANARMAEILGVGMDRLTWRNVEDFFPPADRSMERVRAANLRSHGKVQFDRRLHRSDGTEVWVLACCNLIDSETLVTVVRYIEPNSDFHRLARFLETYVNE